MTTIDTVDNDPTSIHMDADTIAAMIQAGEPLPLKTVIVHGGPIRLGAPNPSREGDS